MHPSSEYTSSNLQSLQWTCLHNSTEHDQWLFSNRGFKHCKNCEFSPCHSYKLDWRVIMNVMIVVMLSLSFCFNRPTYCAQPQQPQPQSQTQILAMFWYFSYYYYNEHWFPGKKNYSNVQRPASSLSGLLKSKCQSDNGAVGWWTYYKKPPKQRVSSISSINIIQRICDS